MASKGPTAAPPEIDALFESFVTGLRGATLRAQLAAKHPERTPEEIEDAIQTAYKCFIDEADGITAPGPAYKWIRTVAHRALNREREHLTRQAPVDPSGEGLDALATDSPTPEQMVIDREDEVDLVTLTETVASTLPDRQRDVLALYGAGYKRPQIADRLDVSERAVKRDLLEIMDRARAALARLAGGGCNRGESLVVRLACGLATPTEASQAQLHLARCDRCQQFHERLNLWREKVGAVMPIPASEQTDPGVLERTLHKTIDGLGAVRQHLADGGAQLKNQANAAYARVADPTPLAGVRPGAAAAVVAGCLTVGGGAATYCIEQGVDPLRAVGLTEPAVPADQGKPNEDGPDLTAPAEGIPQVVTIPAPSVEEVEPEPEPAPAPAPTPAERTPTPPSGADSIGGLSQSPSPSPAPAPPAPAPAGGGTSNSGGSSGATFGGL